MKVLTVSLIILLISYQSSFAMEVSNQFDNLTNNLTENSLAMVVLSEFDNLATILPEQFGHGSRFNFIILLMILPEPVWPWKS